MIIVLRWMAGIAGLLLIVVSPYLFLSGHGNVLWITCPLICAWAFWLMLEYLRWAKTLGKK